MHVHTCTCTYNVPAVRWCSLSLSFSVFPGYSGYPQYPAILTCSIQGSEYTLQLGMYLGYPRYPGRLSIQGFGYIHVPCNLGRTWDVPGIPGYLVFRDLGIYLATWDILGISPVCRDTYPESVCRGLVYTCTCI